MSRASITVLLPECTLINEPDLLRATIKAWQIARSLAIYRVDKVVIYPSRRKRECRSEARVLMNLLEYFRIPPYLKKKLFPLKEEFRYVGLAPPLQTQLHTVSKKPIEGEVREALVVRVNDNKVIVDAGLPQLIEALDEHDRKPSKNELVLVKITSTEPIKAIILSEDEERKIYKGYSVELIDSIKVFLENLKGKAYRIGTSRKGRPAWKAVGSILKGLIENKNIIIVFGEPYRGIYEIMRELEINPEEIFDDILNFIPDQGTKTVRIEEALSATLSIIRFLEAQHAIT